MVEVDLNIDTLSMLIAGIYCSANHVDAKAIPSEIWLEIAEKLEYFLTSTWDYIEYPFEDWICNRLYIYPKFLINEEDLKELQSSTLYWEKSNGNVILSISMDIHEINNE